MYFKWFHLQISDTLEILAHKTEKQAEPKACQNIGFFFSHFWPLTIMQSHRSSLSFLFWTKYNSYMLFWLVFFLVIEMMHYTLKKFIYSLDENITSSLNPTALPVLWFFLWGFEGGAVFRLFLLCSLFIFFILFIYLFIYFFVVVIFFSRTYEMKPRVWEVLH